MMVALNLRLFPRFKKKAYRAFLFFIEFAAYYLRALGWHTSCSLIIQLP